MRRVRSLFYGGLAGAALGVLLAPRLGESRRTALTRLRLAMRTGRASLAGFAGTPCSTAGPTSAQAQAQPPDRRGQSGAPWPDTDAPPS